MSNSMIPKLLLDRGVHSGPAGLLLSSKWISSGGPTVETLCASSIGLERDEAARVFSPYFSNLPSDNLSNRSEASMTHQSIFSMVVMISPRTASTPIRQPLRRVSRSGVTGLSSIPTCDSANSIHIPQNPCSQTAQDKFPLGKCSLPPSWLCQMCSFDLFLNLLTSKQWHSCEMILYVS